MPGSANIGLKPRLTPHARMRFDRRRHRWVLLLPERILMPDEIGVEILQLCNGALSIDEIITTLTERYDTERDVIETDVRDLLAQLISKGALTS